MVMAFQVALAVKNPPADARDIRDAILFFLHHCMLWGAGGYWRWVDRYLIPLIHTFFRSMNCSQGTVPRELYPYLGLTETNKDSRF